MVLIRFPVQIGDFVFSCGVSADRLEPKETNSEVVEAVYCLSSMLSDLKFIYKARLIVLQS
jgi:hypothetical protein